MKEIILTQGKVTQVDDEDFDMLNEYIWCAVRNNRGYGYMAMRNVDGNAVIMHREIMHTPIDLVVDHLDHNSLNNQKINLRNCTQSQNRQNTINRTGSFTGVWQQRSGSWAAQIGVQGKKHYLGTFLRIEDAAIAYNEAAIKFYGEHAYLNKI